MQPHRDRWRMSSLFAIHLARQADDQQAADKALKAALLHRNGRFPYVHDIGVLLARLDVVDVPTQVLPLPS